MLPCLEKTAGIEHVIQTRSGPDDLLGLPPVLSGVNTSSGLRGSVNHGNLCEKNMMASLFHVASLFHR